MICVCIASASVFQSASAFALHVHGHVRAQLGSASGGTSNIVNRSLGHFGWKVQCMHQADIECSGQHIVQAPSVLRHCVVKRVVSQRRHLRKRAVARRWCCPCAWSMFSLVWLQRFVLALLRCRSGQLSDNRRAVVRSR